MIERRARTTKTVNYAALDNGLSDDEDFVDFTPPVKKKKSSVKETKKSTNNEETSPNKRDSKKKSPKQRPSLDERRFQKEIDLALKLSAVEDGHESEDKFSGFESEDVDNDKENIVFSVSSVKSTEVIGIMKSSPDSKALKYNNFDDDEAVASTSAGVTAKRPRKVNFIEDEDSDEWTEDQSSDVNPLSETDEDFCPSPEKKKAKKVTGKQETKSEVGKQEKIKINASVEKLSGRKKSLLPHRQISLITSVDKSVCSVMSLPTSNAHVVADVPKASLKSNSPTLKSLICPVSISKSAKSPSTSKASISSACLTPESGNSKHSFALVKTPFKSPSIGGDNVNMIQKSPAATGLRLGLSRRGQVKPLHPNVCIR